MSNFEIAYKITEKFEGGYSLDKNDRGGETYKGISRKYHPNWEGWRTIDILKSNPKFPEILKTAHALDMSIKRLYKHEYWDIFRGDSLPLELAIEMYDTAVNQGRKTAIRYLQDSLNLLNRNQGIYHDIIVDGVYGSNTHGTLGLYLKKDSMDRLLTVMNIMQGAKYIKLMRENPTQEIYVGWFNRVAIKKEEI